MELTGNENQTKAKSMEEMKDLICRVLQMDKNEWPDDQKVVIEIGYMVLPTLKIEVQK